MTHDSVTLSWTAPDSDTITGYRVLRGDDADSLSTVTEDTGSTDTQYTDQNVVAETTYVYAVQALSPDGDSAQSQTATAITAAPPTPTAEPTTEPPPPPASDEVTGLALSSETAGELVITWNTPTDEPTDYRLSWAPADEEYLPFSEENTSRRGNSYPGGDTTTLTLTGLPEGLSYKVIIRARYEDASGPWTVEVTQPIKATEPAPTPPAAPTGLRTLATDAEVTLVWDDPGDDSITGYQVWRGLEASSLQILAADTGSASNSYLDDTVEAETTYHYAISAINPDGTSQQSDTISATTQATPKLPAQEDPVVSAQQTTITNPAVSDLGSVSTGGIGFTANGHEHATSFNTGSNGIGYALTGARLNLQARSDSVFTVTIYNDNAGNPGTVQRTLTNPSSIDGNSTTSEEFTAPYSLPLAASTKYWVGVRFVSGSNITFDHGNAAVGTAESTTPDPGGLPGWSIGTTRTRSSSTADWANITSDIAIAVLANIIPALTDVEITSKPLQGDTYKAGENVEIEFTFNTPVTHKGGVAAIRVGSGADNYRSAGYMGGSGTKKLLYRYKVRLSEQDGDGVGVDSNALGSPSENILAANGGVVTLTTDGLNNDLDHKVDALTFNCLDILCTDMTVHVQSITPMTVLGAFYSETGPPAGLLSNRSFHLGQNYVIHQVVLRNNNKLELLLDRPPTQRFLSQGKFYVAGTLHSFSDATVDGNKITWPVTGLVWPEGQEIRINLRDNILVTNTGQADSTVKPAITSPLDRLALQFTTGNRARGYKIEAVNLGVRIQTGSGTDVRVAIYSDNSNEPGTSKHILTNPATIDDNLGTFEKFTATDVVLNSRTKYWLVVQRISGTSTVDFNSTASTAQDATTDAGWDLSSSTWTTDTNGDWGALTTLGTTIMKVSIEGEETNITSPAFTKSAETLSVTENAPFNTSLGTITANDPDGDQLEYTVTGTDADDFIKVLSFDRLTGEIKAKRVSGIDHTRIDYETKASYSIIISVTDGEDIAGATEPTATIDDTVAVTITVTDVEETGTVALSRATPRVNIQVTATVIDPDGGVSAPTWQWSKSDTFGGTFTDITGATEASYTPVSADLNKYLKASASYTDRRGPGKNAVSEPARVMAVIFAAPAFPDEDNPKDGADPITLTIDENSPAGTNVGTVRATDEDDDPLTHSVGGTDSLIFASTFDYDTSTGAITLNTGATVDYETKASYSITVTVTDGEDATGAAETTATTDDTVTVTINVTNLDETGMVSLSTSQPQLGVSVTATLTDPDGGITGQTWQWSRGDTANGPFTDVSGATSSTYMPVEDDVGKYLMVSVTYSDTLGSGKSAAKTAENPLVAVLLNQPPIFTRTLTVPENAPANTVVGTVGAVDPEGDTLTYSVSGTDLDAFNEDFTLNTANGQISVRSGATIDSDSRPSYTVTVAVTDGKDPFGRPSSTVDISILLTINVADIEQAGTVTLSRLRPVLDLSLSATLTDPNGGITGQTWQWSHSDTANGPFSDISGATSSSYTPVQADLGKYLKVRVTYSDALASGRSAEATTSNAVTETPVVNAPPTFDPNSYTRTVAENTPADENVGSPITGTDPNNDTLTYSLGGDSAGSFQIVADTGQIRTRYSLNFESTSQHELTVTAHDLDGLTGTATVTVTVTNVEEPGTVTISPGRPRLNNDATATLNDPDGGVSSLNWQWSHADTETGPFSDISGATSAEYTTTDSDNGKYLRVQATYTDTLGSGRSAERVTSGPVITDPFEGVVQFHPWNDAGDLPVGGSATGQIQGGQASDDVRDVADYFELTGLTSGETYQITLTSNQAKNYHFTGITYYGPFDHLHQETMGDFQHAGFTPGRRHILFTPNHSMKRYFIGIKGSSSADHEYTVRLFKPTEDDYEASTSGAAEDDSFGSGKIERLYDVDWHRTSNLSGSTKYLVKLSGAGDDPLHNPVIDGIYDPNGILIADTSDVSSGPRNDSALVFTPDSPGRYYIAVRGNVQPWVTGGADDPTGRGHTGSYTLTIGTVSDPDNSQGTTTMRLGTTDTPLVLDQEYSQEFALEHRDDQEYIKVSLEEDKIYEIYVHGVSEGFPSISVHGQQDADAPTTACSTSWHRVFATPEDFSPSTATYKDYAVKLSASQTGAGTGTVTIKLIDNDAANHRSYSDRCPSR